MHGLVATADPEDRAPARPRLWRVRDQRIFAELRRQGLRSQRGPVTITWLPGSDGAALHPQVAFAVGKRTGGAVVRNRIRRRLRAALRLMQASGRLPVGTYLVSAGPQVAHLPWSELCEAVEAAVATLPVEQR